MRHHNINMASESKQRSIVKAWSSDDIKVEQIPLFFENKNKKGSLQLQDSAWGYINDLPAHVLAYLDSLKELVIYVYLYIYLYIYIWFIYILSQKNKINTTNFNNYI